jgi:hypothetical protein
MRLSALVLSMCVGCDVLATPSDSGDSADTGAPDPDRVGGHGGGHGGGAPAGGWTVGAHPCVGNRTDALWADDADTFWVGCGTTASGYGVYVTRDGGATWEAPMTDPPNWLSGMRADSISRSGDGRIYVGGISGGYQVVSLDTSAEPYEVSEVFTASGQVWDTWQVGAFRRNNNGLAVAESLNGYGLAYRFSDDAPFVDGSYWNPGSYQILDLVLHDDQFYGVGSTIAQPPMVFLPPPDGQDAADGFQLVALQLVEDGLGAFTGELWGIDVDERGVVAVGVNQGSDTGVIFVSGADPYDFDQWRMTDLWTLVPDEPTWMRGVCRNGRTIVAVGEYSMREAGLILVSDEGGVTFADITPAGVPSVQKCEVFDDGEIVVTGMNGWFGTYRP